MMRVVRFCNRLLPEVVYAPSLYSPSITQSSAALLYNLCINAGEFLFAALDETKGYNVSAELLRSATRKELSWPGTERAC